MKASVTAAPFPIASETRLPRLPFNPPEGLWVRPFASGSDLHRYTPAITTLSERWALDRGGPVPTSNYECRCTRSEQDCMLPDHRLTTHAYNRRTALRYRDTGDRLRMESSSRYPNYAGFPALKVAGSPATSRRCVARCEVSVLFPLKSREGDLNARILHECLLSSSRDRCTF